MPSVQCTSCKSTIEHPFAFQFLRSVYLVPRELSPSCGESDHGASQADLILENVNFHNRWIPNFFVGNAKMGSAPWRDLVPPHEDSHSVQVRRLPSPTQHNIILMFIRESFTIVTPNYLCSRYFIQHRLLQNHTSYTKRCHVLMPPGLHSKVSETYNNLRVVNPKAEHFDIADAVDQF